MSPPGLSSKMEGCSRCSSATACSTSVWNVGPLVSQRFPPSWPRPMRPQLAIPGRLGVGTGVGVGAAVGAGEGDDDAAGDLLLPHDGRTAAALRATATANRRVPTNIRPP